MKVDVSMSSVSDKIFIVNNNLNNESQLIWFILFLKQIYDIYIIFKIKKQ